MGLFVLMRCLSLQSLPLRRVGQVVLAALWQLGVLAAGPLQAGPPEPATAKDTRTVEGDAIFHRGELELQFMSGALFSLQDTSRLRPNIDYAPTVFRLGYMLDGLNGRGFLRGNDELMVEALGGPIFTGPGTALGGFSLIYRRNFLSAGARVIPYIQGGAGGIYSDAFHDREQRALGSPFEFDLQGAAGVRFRLTPQWTFDAEFSYRHLSNANLSDRNYGTNAIGGMMGVSYGF